MDSSKYFKKIEFLENKKVIIILENAYLKIGKIGKEFELLDSDNHQSYIINNLKLDYSYFRPDIVHQCLLTLYDSPLNKVRCLKVFINTYENICIEFDEELRIPRTYKRFAKLMAYLLKNLKVRAQCVSKTLCKVVKSPINIHLPTNILKIGTSTKAKKVNLKDYIKKLKPNDKICFVIGAVSKGNPGMENDYVEDSICVSNYSLSASNCLFKVIEAFEELWDIK